MNTSISLDIDDDIFSVFKKITLDQIINIHRNDINIINYHHLEITIRENININDILDMSKLCENHNVIFDLNIGPDTNSENKLVFKNNIKKNSKKNKKNNSNDNNNNNSKIFFTIVLLVILYMIIYN